MLHFTLELTDSKQRKADFKTRDSPGWMRPGGASPPLLMHVNCCHSTVLFLGFQPLTYESGLLLLGHYERSGHSIYPWPWSATFKWGASLFSREGMASWVCWTIRAPAGLREGRTFPGFLLPGGDPLMGWAQTQEGAKALRGRETATFTRWEFKRK